MPSDRMPDAVDLGTISGAEPGETLFSNLVAILGIDAPVSIRVEGGDYRINDGEYTAGPGVVRLGDTVQVRAQAPSTYGTTIEVTLSVGDREATFSISTPTELPPVVVTAESGGGAFGSSLLLLFGLAGLARLRRHGACLVTAMLLSAPAQAGMPDMQVAYAGVRIGQVRSEADSDAVTRSLRDRGYDARASSDADVTGGEVFAGYRLLPWLAVEAGYLRSESRTVVLGGTAPPDLEPLLADAADALQGVGDVLRLGLCVERQLQGAWHVSGRVAGYRWDSAVRAATGDMQMERSDEGFGWVAGVGVRRALSAQVSIGLGADYWRSSGGTDFSLIGVQLQWDWARLP